MGRAARWFRGLLLGGKKAGEPPEAKRLWGSGKSFREKHHHQQQPHREELRLPLYAEYEKERSKRAIAVAAATSAVAEAAVAAAQAAAVVVRLTASGGRTEPNLEEEWAAAAVKIQSTFRGYLARRALKALRGLVKLQALVRGNFVRKQTAETLRCMQALVRVQARARACRVLSSARSQLPAKAFLPRASLCSPNSGTDEDYERAIRPIACSNRYFSLRRNSSRMEVGRAFGWDDDDAAARKATNFSPADDNAKILEVDLGSFARSREMSNHHCYHYSSSCNTRSFPTVLASPSKDSWGESSFLYYGASSLHRSSRKKVDDDGDAQSLCSGCVDCCPNYMAKTESSMAKLRSHSAPRQRAVGKRSSSHVGGQLPPLLAQQRSGPPPPPPPSRHAKFTNRANPGSGRLDRLEMPLKNR
ncbi:protein IQ-DOMAIN 22-like [Zingiber officinale]|uniref:DUF4005 domain-containing protein n=1 Tax=Zingiber officinale TaxID=94328 RepID=A0A8J5L4U4_ZINOF|nr:protein IQ-DOMAIN 22-like [Zingiber officinale]KAG6512215.1 hypothetical protein ZIOFF_030311 [Zingiber officinale]